MARYRLQCQSMKSASKRTRYTLNRRVRPLRLGANSEFGQNRARIEFDDFPLVGLPRVDVDDRRAAVEKLVDRLDMDSWIGSDRPFADNLFERHLAVRLLLNPGRTWVIIVFLEALRQKAPEFGRLPGLVLIADYDKVLDQDRHIGGILSGVSGAAFPFRFVLLPGAGIGNEAIPILAGKPHRFP